MAETAPYGSWRSPISAERVMSAASRVEEVRVTELAVWWSESRPLEGGRSQIVRRSPNGEIADVLPGEFSARSRVHAYGGGAWWLADETVFFVNGADQRIWRLDPGFDPAPLTPEPVSPGGLRYSDGVLSPDFRWIVCVQELDPGEIGTDPGRTEALNRIVAVPATGGAPVVLRSEADFVMSPRLDGRGEFLAWVEWNHPDMPWDRSTLWVGRIDLDAPVPRLVGVLQAAGGDDESIVQPEWDHDDRLWFCSDRSDWWNLYHFARPGRPVGEPLHVAPTNAEVALPAWVFGESRYTFLDDHRVVFASSSDGVDNLSVLDTISGATNPVQTGCTSIHQVRAWGSAAVFIGGSFTSAAAVLGVGIGRSGASSPTETLTPEPEAANEVDAAAENSGRLSSALISAGQPITFPSDGGVAHGIFYPPTNPEFVAPDGERPPLIVMIHGGPTASASSVLNLRVQFWTSRGFAVVDVNHRGSTGFGRRFRNELRGQWGIVDVADCVAAARFLAEVGRADPERLLIRGGSAGGFTTLAALAFTDGFTAGCSLYGISDLELLMVDDHKFESRYSVSLVAPYPEGVAVYRERSPIHHLDSFTRPVIMFQGSEDEVVPPGQTELMASALRERGVPFAAIYFEGEGHGFRRAPNIIRCLEGELSFYAQVLGFPHPADIDPVPVENLG